MTFNSLIYFAFLLAVVPVLWLLPRRARKAWLLLASYTFYGLAHWPYLALLAGCGALNHLGAQWIIAGENRKRRGAWILAGNLGILATFKYLEWLVGNVNLVSPWFGYDAILPIPAWVAPLGVSFFVFQGMGYIVDVVRKRERVHGFWDFQLFMAFFPKIAAGPIMRAKELLPQIENNDRTVASADLLEALWLLTTGLFLKVVVSDSLASWVDEAFLRKPNSVGAPDVYLMAVAYGLQIYLDFSGYTRLALGSARLCGIRLVENFNFPYSAHTPVEFWNRWHMSLSRWIRDYLFFPLLGRGAGLWAMCRATLIAMTLCGIWHGAGWNYLLWGLYHGLLICGYHVAIRLRRAPAAEAPAPAGAHHFKPWAVLLTFGLVSMGWILFRSANFSQSLTLLARALSPWAYRYRTLSGTFYLSTGMLLLAVWTVPLLVARWNRLCAPAAEPRPLWMQLGGGLAQGVAMGCMLVLSLIYLGSQTAFVYFQF